jgi:hypothetical protein
MENMMSSDYEIPKNVQKWIDSLITDMEKFEESWGVSFVVAAETLAALEGVMDQCKDAMLLSTDDADIGEQMEIYNGAKNQYSLVDAGSHMLELLYSLSSYRAAKKLAAEKNSIYSDVFTKGEGGEGNAKEN